MPTLKLTLDHRIGRPPPTGPLGCLLFERGKCETCGREVREVNALRIPDDDVRKLSDLGVPIVHLDEYPEIWYDEDLDQTICERADCKDHVNSPEE